MVLGLELRAQGQATLELGPARHRSELTDAASSVDAPFVYRGCQRRWRQEVLHGAASREHGGCRMLSTASSTIA